MRRRASRRSWPVCPFPRALSERCHRHAGMRPPTWPAHRFREIHARTTSLRRCSTIRPRLSRQGRRPHPHYRPRGQQVSDLWAFPTEGKLDWLSTSQTRDITERLFAKPGRPLAELHATAGRHAGGRSLDQSAGRLCDVARQTESAPRRHRMPGRPSSDQWRRLHRDRGRNQSPARKGGYSAHCTAANSLTRYKDFFISLSEFRIRKPKP